MRADSLGLFWQDIPEVKIRKEKIKKVPPARVWEQPDFLPYFDEAKEFNVELYTDQELVTMVCEFWKPENKEKLIFDIESYWNYFCIGFKGEKSGKIVYFECFDDAALTPTDIAKLDWIIHNFTIISFNGISYDIPILTLALAGNNTSELKRATNLIIQGDRENGVLPMRPSDILKLYKVKRLKDIDHIDLIEVAPLDASLKIYSGRLHCKRVQDLPYQSETILSPDQKIVVRWYCLNDLENTVLLYRDLEPAIELREQIGIKYGVDLRSKSDAQIAESIIEKEIYLHTGIYPKRPENVEEQIGIAHKYNVPAYIKFNTPNLQWVLNTVRNSYFTVGASGRMVVPDELKDVNIPVGTGLYSFGGGGLHSQESSVTYKADENTEILDRDVRSYYPRIIINLGLYPKHLGEIFLPVYSGIVERRLKAKEEGDILTAETLKITVNGSFGKMGNKYSLLYEPQLVIQTTVTGQLALLMLIERLVLAGFNVVSANTDGVVAIVPKATKDKYEAIIYQWELDTGFETEETSYKALYSRDVNNYIAVKDNNETKLSKRVKLKGAYGEPDLKKTPQNEICVQAVLLYLLDGTDIASTISSCKDITKFVTLRKVRGGAAKVYAPSIPEHILELGKEQLVEQWGYQSVAGMWYNPETNVKGTLDEVYEECLEKSTPPGRVEYLGSTCRWYYAHGIEGEIVIAATGNKVPKSDGAKPIPDMPTEFPNDINLDWYIEESYSILRDIGAIIE